jgi:ABC-type antimicrobial peptide transport system permease subunit
MEYKNVYVLRELLGPDRPVLFGLIAAGPGVDPAEAAHSIRRHLAEMGSRARAWDRKSWARRITGATESFAGLVTFLWVAILAITAVMAAAIIAIAVRGRYREIAIRRVEGGRRIDILAQLLLENVLITVAAAALGFCLAVIAGVWLESDVLGWPIVFRPRDLALIVLAGAALAIATTFLPAYRASTLSPVQVLERS